MSAVRLLIRVRPGARRSEVVGYADAVLRVDVAAPATENRANDELVRLLAKELGIARGRVQIVRGQTAREKLVEIDLDRERVDAWTTAIRSRCSPTDPNR